MGSRRLLDASALLDDSFAEMLSATAYKWESTLRLAEAAVQSPAARTGTPAHSPHIA